jgi:hypothetical protein
VSRAYGDLLGWPLFIGRYPVSPAQLGPARTEDVATHLTTTCATFDAVDVPFDAGMYAQVLYDRENFCVPCLSYGRHTVTFLVESGTGQSVRHLPGIRVRTGWEERLTLPPAPRVRWDTPPWNCSIREAVTLHDAQDLLPGLDEAMRLLGPGCFSLPQPG